MATRKSIVIGDIVHTYNRGTRKLDIVHDELDKEYFLKALFYLNDSHSIPNIFRVLKEEYPDLMNRFEWPKDWKERDPLVRIHAYVLMPNHFHLVLEEIREGGVSLFMQKFGTGFTCRYNLRYEISGNLFQGRYKYVHVPDENYLQYLGVYVQIKNVFELFDSGLDGAVKNFDKAFDFACSYRYGSLSHYFGEHFTQAIGKVDSVFNEMDNKKEYKKFVKSIISEFDSNDDFSELKLD